MKVGILTFEKWHGKEFIGSSRIRGSWLIDNWEDAELFRQGEKYDVVIFQKVYWLDYAKNFNGIKILDLCDPDWLDTQPMIELINNCDAVTVSSEGLLKSLKNFTDKPVIYVPDRQDLKFHFPPKEKHEGKAEWAVWFGYSHNIKLLDKTLLTLKRLNLKLKVIHNCQPPYAKADKNIKYDFKDPLFNFNKEITDCDIVLLPPDNRPRGEYKSNNKTLTAWALGMPVATNVDELKKFIDPEERQKESEKRLKEVKEKWDVKYSIEELKNLINNIKK
jgi:hypothetical protein